MANAPKKSAARPPPPLDKQFGGDEHRQFPRAKMSVPFKLWMGEGNDRRFSASLTSSNISVSGAFIESTFFLPVGKKLSLSFELDAEEEPPVMYGGPRPTASHHAHA